MNANQFRLMFIPLLATLILGGFVTTVGLLTEPAALKYGVELTDIASQFTWFTGGVFLGGILAFFVFDYFAIKPVILWSYAVSVGLIIWLHFSAQYFLLPFLLTVIGALMAIVMGGWHLPKLFFIGFLLVVAFDQVEYAIQVILDIH